jgi:hypothetical protein
MKGSVASGRTCVILYTYIYIYIYIYIHSYMCTCIYTYTHTHMHTYIHTYIHKCIHTSMQTNMDTNIHIHSFYLHMCRGLRQSLRDLDCKMAPRVFAVLSDTLSTLANFAPSLEQDPSTRAVGKALFQPFIQV